MTRPFQHLERALDGQNKWIKYVGTFLVAFLGGQAIGVIPLLWVIISRANEKGIPMETALQNVMDFSMFDIDPVFGLVLMLIPFVVSLLLLIWMLRVLHKRSLSDTINGRTGIRWGRFFFSAMVWAAMMGVLLLGDYFINPDNFVFNFNLSSFLPLLLVSLLLIPLQTTFEELLFRGYLAQGIGAASGSRWLALIIPSVIFGLIHIANPEVEAYGFLLTMPQYIGFGLVFGLVSILDDGIECAMGAHAANNTFLSLFVTSQASALQTPAILEQMSVDPTRELIILFTVCAVFVAILYKKYNWDFSIMGEGIERQVEA